MRQTIASDFHDQTGNMLAAINRQATMLELKLGGNTELMVFVRSIIDNSNGLYASSKDFLWTLNYESDNPATLFQYLTGYGQNFYNQFDISFSAESKGCPEVAGQLDPFAALNLIYIFKEAITNVIKHTAADEVLMTMELSRNTVNYILSDNGEWKQASNDTMHYGLNNMKRRAAQSGFEYALTHGEEGTRISVCIPLSHYLIEK
jgi:signal transduction histidine kinase